MGVWPLTDAPFASSLRQQSLPGLGIVFGTSSSARYERTRAQSIAENLTLMVHLEGKATISQHGHNLTFGDGEAALLSGEEVGGAMVPGKLSYLALHLPASVLRPMIANPSSEFLRQIRRENAFLRLLVRYVVALLEPGVLEAPNLRRLAVTHVHDLVAMMVGADREACEIAKGRGVRAGRLRLLVDDIVDRLGEANLTVDTLAGRHQISPRYIRKLFEAEGTTFSDFVRGQRLALAHRLLCDPRRNRQQISAIAFECGFGDLSHFNQAFRRRYGATPSEIRAAARADTPLG
ncbi:helix-turn-helix transcriptional regulator [Rhizobium sp. BR 314]|uniref:AraC family transcriptional regulator n=1 Tax=Rhizobium sp. BR 314 TaxID=3040013 RepID=UPI0039C00122